MEASTFDLPEHLPIPAEPSQPPARPARPASPVLASGLIAALAGEAASPGVTPHAEPMRLSGSASPARPAYATAIGSIGEAEASGPRLPPMPEIGLDEHAYARMARKADERADREARDAAKVGYYVSAALDPKMTWHEKRRHFEHALHKHCHHSKLMSTRVWQFYHDLAHLVRAHCGQEALRIASRMDDLYAARQSVGISRRDITRSAREFFAELVGDGSVCPEYLLEDDFHQILVLRDQWVATQKS